MACFSLGLAQVRQISRGHLRASAVRAHGFSILLLAGRSESFSNYGLAGHAKVGHQREFFYTGDAGRTIPG
jgi:hypothetical protein